MAGRVKIAVDTGGTFTDICLFDEETRELSVKKVSSTPGNPALAVTAGILEIIKERGTEPGEMGMVLHGTTVATNALLERRGAPAALITTAGFRDLLYIGRQNRAWLPWKKPGTVRRQVYGRCKSFCGSGRHPALS